jgi:ribonuclease Z
MNLQFVGTASVIPEPGRETASLLVNGRHLVDAGWSAPLKLRETGIDPVRLESMIFTHFHHDHYLGLPQLLHGMMRQPGSGRLRIAGPAEFLETIVERSCALLQWDRFPELHFPIDLQPLHPGDSLDLGDIRLETISSRHVSGKGALEPALSLRFIEGDTAFVYSGDTSYNTALAPFTARAGVLVHDAAHTPPRQAAQTAVDAGVDRLYLIHYPLDKAADMLNEALAVFPGSDLARDGELVVL